VIKVIDNIINVQEQENIKNKFLGDDNMNWFFQNDVSLKNNLRQQRPGFCHHFYRNNKINSDVYFLIEQIVTNTVKKLKWKNYTIDNLIEARSFLQLPLNKDFIGTGVDTPHLDRTTPHTVFLYYVNNSDGHTIIYNYKSKNKDDIPYAEDVKILKKVKPKQGRVVVFDGLHWHTAEQPTKDVRCIINFNISTNGT